MGGRDDGNQQRDAARAVRRPKQFQFLWARKFLPGARGFRLTVGPNAKLQADVVAREAMISGKVVGNISASDRIEVMKSASIEGNVSTGRIAIEEGAYFSGDLEVDSRNKQIGTDLDTLLKGAPKAEGK